MDGQKFEIKAKLTKVQEQYIRQLSALVFRASERVKSIEVHLLGDMTLGLRIALQVSTAPQDRYEYLWINEIDIISDDFPSYLFEDPLDKAKDFLYEYGVEYVGSSPPQYLRIARKEAELVIEVCEAIKKAIKDARLERFYIVENVFNYVLIPRDQRYIY